MLPVMASPFEQAFSVVQSLAHTFEANKAQYLSAEYNESAVRKDFIDKFLIALGWDVNHDQQTNPFEQEVKVERALNVHGAQRRADYAFYIAPNFRDVRFYTEAKKPFADIETAQNYFQTIRYGWNAQTPVAVLTDFEKFHILDCRYKPDIDTALGHCLHKVYFSEYADKDIFGVVYWLFSREAVANGSLDKYAATLPKQRGKAIQRGLFKAGYQAPLGVPCSGRFLGELPSQCGYGQHVCELRVAVPLTVAAYLLRLGIVPVLRRPRSRFPFENLTLPQDRPCLQNQVNDRRASEFESHNGNLAVSERNLYGCCHSSSGMNRPLKSPDPTTRPERSTVWPLGPSSGLKVASNAPERERIVFL